MKRFLKKSGTFLVSVILLGYVLLQLYPTIHSSITSETVYTYSAYETLNVDCVAIRNETTVPLNTSNYVFYTVQNGTRVANGGLIAELYTNKDNALAKQELEKIDLEIADLKEIQSLGASGVAGLNILNTQIERTMSELVEAGSASSVSELHDLRQRLLGYFNKKQTVTGKVTDFSEHIKTLEKRRASIAASYKAAVGTVTAPVAGYFVDRVDGLETVLTVKDVKKTTTDNIKTALASELTDSKAYAGKIVSDYSWYIGCVVPGEYTTTLAVGRELRVRLPLVTDEQIPVKVIGCNRDEAGDLAVIFECVNMSEALSAVRKESLEILLVEHTGLRVPKRAITTNAAQEVGVYVRAGDIVRFRRIEQKYSDAAEYVICEVRDEDGYLRLYDDIITEGSNLYDGKLIR